MSWRRRSCSTGLLRGRRLNPPGPWAMVGGEVFLKCENLQRAGSFKVRGAYVRMAKLVAGGEEARRRGGLGRQPRPGRGGRGEEPGHQGPHLHAAGRGPAQARRHPKPRRRGGPARPQSTRPSPRRSATPTKPAPSSSTPSTTRTSSPARAPSAWRSWNRSPTSTPSSWASAAADCWPGSPSRSRPGRRTGPGDPVIGVQAENAAPTRRRWPRTPWCRSRGLHHGGRHRRGQSRAAAV